MSDESYIYLIVRSDLSHAQQIIQAAHAVERLNKPVTMPVSNIVLFSVKDEEMLMLASMKLTDKGIMHEVFYEPDINSNTALAAYPIAGNFRKVFSKYKMLR